MKELNTALLKLSKRAETYDVKHLVETFVDVGPLFTLLSNPDNQILYGRRGTGKTHILSYLVEKLSDANELAVQIDMRTIGSTGGIYADNSIPVSERATRLLVDTMLAIHDKILSEVLEKGNVYNLSVLGPLLDRFAEASVDVAVIGVVETQEKASTSKENSMLFSSGAELSPLPKGRLNVSLSDKEIDSMEVIEKRSGNERLRVHFGRVGNELGNLIKQLPNGKFWLVLDEWSEVPLDLQPFLADLLRRTLFPVRGVSIKIAAIEQRCSFRIDDKAAGHIGIEVGADAAASLNLDEFMVFENDAVAAKNFFQQLLYKHVKAIWENDNFALTPIQLINEAFTQGAAFDEFVRSAEGVPRDAINIIGIAAQKAVNDKISVPNIRESAKIWYHRGKEKAITSKPTAQALLTWVIEEVIQNKQAKAFLLKVGVKNELIDFLYDQRVLHLIKQGVSAQDYPGVRFNVYAIDYGCYVDLINTTKAPKGLFEIDEDSISCYVQVPQTDFRSIRRAILDLEKFDKFLRISMC